MNLLRIFLVVLSIIMIGYTGYVLANDGFFVLYSIAATAIQAGGWLGQFTIDLTSYVLLSAIWTAWRNQFTGSGLLMAVAVGTLGMFILAPYLLLLTFQTNGDAKRILIGDRA